MVVIIKLFHKGKLMKHIYTLIVVVLLSSVASLNCFAEDKPMKKNMEMDMGMSVEMQDKMAREKQKYILQIDDLSDRIKDEKNPQKKQALMDEQLKLIKDHQAKKMEMKKKMMKKHHEKMMNQKKSMKM